MAQSSPKSVSVFAPAKINLYLHVTGKRADGFHLLDSLICFADYGDQITAQPADELSLTIDGPFSKGLSTGRDNLVLKTAVLLAALADIDAKAEILLTKNLPIASGIGGGSADAAAALHALAELWGISPTTEDLLSLAEKLGADVPVCVLGSPCFISSIGEVLTPAPALPSCWLVLVNPNAPVSTPEVFAKRNAAFSPAQPFDLAPASFEEFADLLSRRNNDLTPPALTIAPVIQDVLAALDAQPGQSLTRLSGSGATCFGLFPSEKAANSAATALEIAHPRWWVKSAALRVKS